MYLTRLILLAIALCLSTGSSGAQESSKPSPLDDRGGMPVPKDLQDLKNLSLTFWLKFRQTDHRLYSYINKAAKFHAYTNVCKRNQLNISMGPIVELANKYLQASIPAHYEELDFAVLEPLSKEKQQIFLDDMSSDLYAFEYGYRVAIQNQNIKESGKSKKVYCQDIEHESKLDYVSLRAIAKIQLNR